MISLTYIFGFSDMHFLLQLLLLKVKSFYNKSTTSYTYVLSLLQLTESFSLHQNFSRYLFHFGYLLALNRELS